MDGQPFMVINKVVDPGLIKVIENDILPELEGRVPKQAEKTSTATQPYPISSRWFLTVRVKPKN